MFKKRILKFLKNKSNKNRMVNNLLENFFEYRNRTKYFTSPLQLILTTKEYVIKSIEYLIDGVESDLELLDKITNKIVLLSPPENFKWLYEELKINFNYNLFNEVIYFKISCCECNNNVNCINGIVKDTIKNDFIIYIVTNRIELYVLKRILEIYKERYFGLDIENVINDILHYLVTTDRIIKEFLKDKELIKRFKSLFQNQFLLYVNNYRLKTNKEYINELICSIYKLTLSTFGVFYQYSDNKKLLDLVNKQYKNGELNIFSKYTKELINFYDNSLKENLTEMYYFVFVVDRDTIELNYWLLLKGILQVFLKEKYKKYSIFKDYFLINTSVDFNVKNYNKLLQFIKNELILKNKKLKDRIIDIEEFEKKFEKFIKNYITQEFKETFMSLQKLVYEISFWILLIREFNYDDILDLFINYYYSIFKVLEKYNKYTIENLDLYYQLPFISLYEFVFTYKPSYYRFYESENSQTNAINIKSEKDLIVNTNYIKEIKNSFISKIIENINTEIELLYSPIDEENETEFDDIFFREYEKEFISNISKIYDVFETSIIKNKFNSSIYLKHILGYTEIYQVIDLVDFLIASLTEGSDNTLNNHKLTYITDRFIVEELTRIIDSRKLPFYVKSLRTPICKTNNDTISYCQFIDINPDILNIEKNKKYKRTMLKPYNMYISKILEYLDLNE